MNRTFYSFVFAITLLAHFAGAETGPTASDSDLADVVVCFSIPVGSCAANAADREGANMEGWSSAPGLTAALAAK